MILHPWTFSEDAKPVLLHSRCRIYDPTYTPNRIIPINVLAMCSPCHPTCSHHNALWDVWIQNATSGISSTPTVIFIDTHLLLQQLHLHPLNPIIMAFLSSSQLEPDF